MAAKKAEAKTEKPEKADKSAPKKASSTEVSAPYVVFARRFRPQSFADVVGQSTVTNALRHALKTGRLAHAFLFCGPRGVGKTSLARIFSKALNCTSGKGQPVEEPCNECEACLSIQNGSSLDVIEMDAATNRGINEVRDLRESVALAPSQLHYKVYIVDEVHMLTTEAWNAFLKTLEEPPGHVKFIFATTDADRIPETILSRCQRFDLRRIGLVDIVKRLKQICEGDELKFEQAALERLAGLARGGLRDAEGMLDQAVTLGQGNVAEDVVREISGAAPDEVIFSILTACAEGKTADALTQAGGALDAGADPDDLLRELLERLRGGLLYKTCGKDSALLDGQSHLGPAYEKLGTQFNEDQLLQLLQLFSHARRQVRDATQGRLPLEMALVRAARARELVDLGKLVSALESGAAIGAPRAGVASTSAPPGGPPHPNPSGRSAGEDEPRRAALNDDSGVASAGTIQEAAPVQAAAVAVTGGPEKWGELLAAVRPLTGGAMIAGALSHAQAVLISLDAGTFELWFSPAKGFYRESLERPERAAALTQSLEKTYGRAMSVALPKGSPPANAVAPGTVEKSSARLSAVAAPTPPAQPVNSNRESKRPAAESPAPLKKTPDELPPDHDVEVEDSSDYVDEGALPLPETRQGGEADDVPSDAGVDDDDDVGAPVKKVPPVALESSALPVENKKPEARPRVSENKLDWVDHPAIQALLKKVDGELVDVVRETLRPETDKK